MPSLASIIKSPALSVVIMLAGVVAVYFPPSLIASDKKLMGMDHRQLHERRMRFAREALLPGEGKRPALPAWYPREFMGTPFWSNLQSFPFIPTRLLIVLSFDPETGYAPAVTLSAALAAVFTWLACRRIFDLPPWASAVAGWTFACSGFYASRILAGHLPLLEGYLALPLLLWLVDRAVIRRDTERGASGGRAVDLPALGFACTCLSLTGHPQLPIYAMTIAALYALWTAFGRRGFVAIASMLLGVGAAGFALYPMALLTGRSQRVLPLELANNDLAFPWERLPALFFPWRDGYPPPLWKESLPPFSGYPNLAHFWDTVNYIGWAPWIGLLALIAATRGVRTGRAATFVIVVAVAALVMALPPWQRMMQAIPGTILRSPARLMYVVTFAMSLALAAALAWAMRAAVAGRWSSTARGAFHAALVLIVVTHAIDLSRHARVFILPQTRVFNQMDLVSGAEQIRSTLGEVGWRVGFDSVVETPINRQFDDFGVFDSLLLARPYQFVLATSRQKANMNYQALDAGLVRRNTLEACGVRMVVTNVMRPDLQPASPQDREIKAYIVPNPSPRAQFYAIAETLLLEQRQTDERLRSESTDLHQTLLLPPDAPRPTSAGGGAAVPFPSVTYKRPSPDEIRVNVSNDQPGYLRVIECFDPGWRATVDGQPVAIIPANNTFLAVPLAPGSHEVVFRYSTHGVRTGTAISGVSVAGLVVLAVVSSRLSHP
jgi:hypothetical protein